MKFAPWKVVLAALAVCGVAHAQEWKEFTSEKFNAKFEIPADWAVEMDDTTVIAAPEDGAVSFVLVSYKDSNIGTEQLFNQFVNEIGLDAQGEYEEVENFNGFHGMVGGGAATIEGEPVMMIVAALTSEDNNLVGYLFADPNQADALQPTMERVLQSISVLNP